MPFYIPWKRYKNETFTSNNIIFNNSKEKIIGNVCVLGGKKCSFFGKFDLLCFLETPVLKFTLLPYYLQDNTRDYY